MFRILDGRETFYQWDINQKLIVDDASIEEVHFCTRACSEALVVKVIDGLAAVPNILLQKAFDLKAYAYTGEDYTKVCETFKVIERNKPADYIYTETEVENFDKVMSYTKKRYYVPCGGSNVCGLIYQAGSTKCTLIILGLAKTYDGTYQANIPFEYATEAPPEGAIDVSPIINIYDFKPMIKNKYIGNKECYSLEHIDMYINGYYTEANYVCTGLEGDEGIFYAFQMEYRFSSSNIATAFYNQFQAALEETEAIILEYQKPETVITYSHEAVAPLEVGTL